MTEQQSLFKALNQQISDALALFLGNIRNNEIAKDLSGFSKEELSEKLAPLIEPIFDKFKLVPMAEFEAQAALLQKLKSQIERMDNRLKELDKTGE